MSALTPPQGPTSMPTPGPTPGIRPDLSPGPVMRQRRYSRSRRQLGWGLFFLAPNLLGFLCFTLIPLVMSLVMAFTNWNLQLHNQAQDAQLIAAGESPMSIKFVGLEHFSRLIWTEFPFDFNDRFIQYLGNTLFFMIGLPIGIALSLMSALLLSQDLRGGSRKGWLIIVLGAVMTASCGVLAAYGMGMAAITTLMCGIFGLILVGGSLGGQTVYRTLFFIPNFTAGVATMLLWKKMYNPVNGPFTEAMDTPLGMVSSTVNALGGAAGPIAIAIFVLLLLASAGVVHLVAARLLRQYRDGDIGEIGLLLAAGFLILGPLAIWAFGWVDIKTAMLLATTFLVGIGAAIVRVGLSQEFPCRMEEGVGSALMLSVGGLVGALVLAGLALVARGLPELAADGLKPPNWLLEPNWAKPSLMMMGLWAAIGSQTMLLYLAALTNVPGELYEAADIDGASRGQKFWNVTWPQLAPTTFFVIVMGVIHGLQGGFEMARVMTQGGPAGSTTTLAYFIYTEGFETGRLGFSSAVSWTMFLLVLSVTLFNWKFGNRYVND